MQGDSSSSDSPSRGAQQGESGQRRDSAEAREGEQQGQQEGRQPGEQPGQQESPQQDQPGEGQPRGDQADRPGGQKDPRTLPPTEVPRRRARGNVEIWGNLPIHLRDIYRAEGREDLPAQYRDWIDSYYRRLNTAAATRAREDQAAAGHAASTPPLPPADWCAALRGSSAC